MFPGARDDRAISAPIAGRAPASQAIGAEIDGRKVGSYGITGCFSLHPLKNINVWGDGGLILTNSKKIRDILYMIRNNGLINRDECEIYAYNCRLDTLQAVVGIHILKDIENITRKRVENGKKPLKIVKISYVLAEDKKPISSTRIYKNEIDDEGRVIQ